MEAQRAPVVRNELQKFISEHLLRQGYQQVITPHIGRLELYKTNGHYPYYRAFAISAADRSQDQIDALTKEGCSCARPKRNRMSNGTIDGYLLKPMNCPHHIKIYSSDPHSYRDLPVRLAEFGTVYRWEKSGEKLRRHDAASAQVSPRNDAHLFCTEEQLPAELHGCLDLVKIVFATLGMTDYRVRVGMRDPDSAQIRRPRRSMGQSRSRLHKAAAKSLGVGIHHRTRRSRVLRTEDRFRRQGRDRTDLGSLARCRWITSFPSASALLTRAPTTNPTRR